MDADYKPGMDAFCLAVPEDTFPPLDRRQEVMHYLNRSTDNNKRTGYGQYL